MSDQTPNDPSSTPPGPPPSAPPPPPPSAPPVGDYSAPSYATAGAQPVPTAGAVNNVPDFLSPTWMMNNAPAPAGYQPKQKIVAGIIAILIGSLGIHSFYLGNSKKGIIQLVVGIVTCFTISGIWALVEGIMILIGNVKTDAYGVPLTE